MFRKVFFRMFAVSLFVLGWFSVVAAAPDGPINEVEPNNNSGEAQNLAAIGRENYVNAAINAGGDQDWYKFSAEAGVTYVVELFEVDASLNTISGGQCGHGSDYGVGLNIYDASVTEIAYSCLPNYYNLGAGNVHNIAQFTAGLNGIYYFRVISNSTVVIGNYKVRVLLPYNHLNASWDDNFEPNNRLVNAAEILVGREHAISSDIEARIVGYATNFVDSDWYHFEAEANKPYVIELFNVDVSLNVSSGGWCGHGNGYGVGLSLYDASGTEITYSCLPSYYSMGAGNVHNILAFTPGLAGTYFIRVIPNNESLNGDYSLRVLPQYIQPEASWDAKFEPNNVPHNAYLLAPSHPLTTDIETRLANYATNFVDRDWYRIEAQAGESYTIETYNVSSSLATGSGSLCQGYTRTGLGMRVYDPTLSTIIALQCTANGSGNVHTTLTFVADVSGTYFIWILPNSSTVSGSYSVRLGGGEKVYLPMVKR
ncbi:MAG: PPC domain-containing protein [Anaerolineales bacterium]|nr:PPC domain-containing protein [Anaerolineales bacterium]